MVGDPGIGSMAKLEQVVKGIKSNEAKHRNKIKQKSPRLPITPELLLRIKGV